MLSKRINLNWIFILMGLAALVDLCIDHGSAYYNDPVSIAISLAISAATTAGAAGIQYLQAKKQKVSPVDRGKQDDIRLSVPGYGEAIVKGWGTFRVAPIWFWHTPIVHTTVTTQGRSGGKGTPKPPTPDTIDHIYTTSLAGVFHDGIIYKGVSRIWFDSDLVFNADLSNNLSAIASTKYEAEHGVLAGGASVAAQAECSGGFKVTGLGSGGNVTIHVDVTSTDDYEVAVHYTSTADRTFKVSVNGGGTTDLVCPASGAASIVAVQTITLSLTSGDNTIKFENSGAACPDLDFIDVAPALSFTNGEDRRSFTGLVDPNKVAPTDPDTSWPTANEVPVFSDTAGGMTNGGFYTATLSKWGNPQIRIYPGSETQEPDPAIIADKGTGNAPAYRGFAYLVIEGLQLQNGRIPNVTVEVQQGIREAATIIQDLYELVGRARTDVDVTALNGLVLGDSTGFDPGTYSSITWAGLNNATQGSGGAISKTSGTDNTWNAYANNGSTVSAGTDASIRFTASAGTFMIGFATTSTPGSALPHPYDQVPFAVLLNLNSNPSQESKNSIQMSLGGSNNSSDVGTWAVGDKFQVEIRNGKFSAYQNGLLLTGFSPPVPSFPLTPIFVGYHTGGGVSSASYATGSNIGSEPVITNVGGLVLTSRRTAADLIAELQTRFQFDIPEVDGKVKCVLRSGTSELTIGSSELRAHYYGEEAPDYDALITDIDPLLLPATVDVNYLEPQLDYHNNTQSDMRLTGPQFDSQSVSLSMVESSDNMKKLATVLLFKPEREGRTFNFTTGPKYTRLHQGSVVTLSLTNATHVVRIENAKYGLPAGVCEFEAVRQEASLYSPSGSGAISSGVEAPIAPIPGNTKGVLIDGPLLRAEDAGDGSQPTLYVAMCGRGAGSWPGGFLYQEFPADSGNYTPVTNADKASGIGVTAGTLASVSDASVWDRTNTLTINFLSNVNLSSATEDELVVSPELNLLAIINPSTNAVEYIQFKTAAAGAASAPYITNYTVSTLLRGRICSDSNVGSHTSADDVVVIDSTIKPRRLDLSYVDRSVRYKFVTSGQSVDDAAVVTQTFHGNSLKPLSVVNARGFRDSGNDLLIEFEGRTRIGGGLRSVQAGAINEEEEEYRVQILNSGSTTLPNGRERIMRVIPGMQQAAVLLSSDGAFGGVTHNSFSPSSILAARTYQEIHQQGNFIEGTFVYPAGGGIACFGLQQSGRSWKTIGSEINDFQGSHPSSVSGVLAMPYLVTLEGITSNAYRMQVFEYGTRILTVSSLSSQSDYDPDFGWDSATSTGFIFRVRFELVGSSVVIKKAHRADLPLVRIAAGSRNIDYPLFGVMGTDSTTLWGVSGIVMTTYPFPKTIYSSSQQSEDGFTPGDPVQMDILQYSKLVGDGTKVRVTL